MWYVWSVWENFLFVKILNFWVISYVREKISCILIFLIFLCKMEVVWLVEGFLVEYKFKKMVYILIESIGILNFFKE